MYYSLSYPLALLVNIKRQSFCDYKVALLLDTYTKRDIQTARLWYIYLLIISIIRVALLYDKDKVKYMWRQLTIT